MPPISLAKKGVIGGLFACAKIGVQICICAYGWALPSPDLLCKSF